MRKIKTFSIILGIVAIMLSTTIVYAYFTNKIDSSTHGITSNLNDTSVIEVQNSKEFLEAIDRYNYDLIYNSNETKTDNRKTIRLIKNISINQNALVTADCHIDLNNYSIDLKGHKLTFKHQYDGVFSIYGGTITNSSDKGSKVIVDCPNACVDFSSDVIVDTNVDITVSKANEELVTASAMNLVYSNLIHGVIDLYETTDLVKDNYLESCMFDHQNSNGTSCCYTYKDLDFIYSYFAYSGLTVGYSSSNLNVLSDTGKVTLPQESTTIDLTITITYNDVVLEKTIAVHVVLEEDYIYASNQTLLIYLQKYYDENKYVFDKSFLLPKENKYFNTTYSYTLSNGVTSSTQNDYFDIETYDDFVVVGLSKDITTLSISSSDGTNTTTTNALAVDGKASSNLDDNYSYAIGIVTDLYGNCFEIENDTNTSGYTTHSLLTDVTIKGYSRLQSIEYSLVNNNEDTYVISDYATNNEKYNKYKLLKYNTEATKPYLGQTVYVAIKFTFNEDLEGNTDVITIQIPIIYTINEPVTGFGEFDPYYVYFNKEFNTKTNNFSYSSFEMPLIYGDDYPSYGFVIYAVNSDNSYEKIETGNLFTLSSTDDYYNLTSKSKLSITINPYYINPKNTTYYFLYVPVYLDDEGLVFDAGDDIYTSIDDVEINPLDYQYKSILTVPGIARYETSNSQIEEVFKDKELYKIVYEILNEDEYTGNNQYILSSKLTQYISVLDFSNGTDSLLNDYGYTINISSTDNDNEINSLKGLDSLIGVSKLTFNGTNLTSNNTLDINQIEHISKMTNLEILDFSSTGIYDQLPGTFGMPDGNSNNILSILSNLKNLKELYLASNQIYDFSDLLNFVSLTKVDVSYNTFTVTAFNFSLIDNMLTNLVNSIYGSSGSTNKTVFATLQANQIDFINEGESTVPTEEIKQIIEALSSLEYQDRVSKDISIETVYLQYPTTNIYGILDSYVVEENDTRIRYVLESISFTSSEALVDGKYTANSFSINIEYSWSYSTKNWIGNWNEYGYPDGMTAEDCVVTYKYIYKVTRY